MSNKTARAVRKVFIPLKEGNNLVEVKEVDFTWHKGMSLQVRQRSVKSFHEEIINKNIAKRPLEISSKSLDKTGIELSAFNLSGKKNEKVFTVETVFQSSKVFKGDNNSPYRFLLYKTSKTAKKCPETKNKIISHFKYIDDTIWDTEPKTAFYDWVYINILIRFNPELAHSIMDYDAFTDIEFNHKKSLNSQAYSVALYKALKMRGYHITIDTCGTKEKFMSILSQYDTYKPDTKSIKTHIQPKLPLES